MANLERWVNDRLYDILGLSDRYLPLFMIGTAQKSSSPQDFVSRLEQTGAIDVDQKVIAFAQELFDKVSFKLYYHFLVAPTKKQGKVQMHSTELYPLEF